MVDTSETVIGNDMPMEWRDEAAPVLVVEVGVLIDKSVSIFVGATTLTFTQHEYHLRESR